MRVGSSPASDTSNILFNLKCRLWHFFTKTSTFTSSELSSKASNILGIFKKTIDGLSDVISQARNQADVKQKEIDAALAEKESLIAVAEQNQIILNKLTELLE